MAYAVGFVAVFLVLDFEDHWDWSTLTYRELWTPSGLVRNLFYDGFRSVLPWTGFLLVGMWLGRQPLAEPNVNRRVALVAIGTAVCAEVVSSACVAYLLGHPHDLDAETIHAIAGTESMPPLPLFLLASGGEAIAIITLCVRLERGNAPRWLTPMARTGQMALTWYVAHIIVGLGGVVALGLEESQSLFTAVAAGVGFFAAAFVVSWIWRARFRYGPLEGALRAAANWLS